MLQRSEEGDGSVASITFFICLFCYAVLQCYSAAKKAMAAWLLSPSSSSFLLCCNVAKR
jgi:hypothetical protein